MKQIATIVVLTLLIIHCNGQTLNIYLNTNDCIDCTSALSLVSELDTSISITIYADVAKKRFIPDVLNKYNPTNRISWNICYVETEELLAMAPSASQCIYRAPGRIERNFPLKRIAGYLNFMNLYSRNYTRNIISQLSHVMKISDRIDMETGSGKILISDYLLGKIYMVRLNESDTSRFESVLINKKFKYTYLKYIGLNMHRYDSLLLILKSKGMDNLNVTASNWCLDTLYLYANAFYPGHDPGDSSFVMIQDYPVFLKMVGDTIYDWRRCDWRLPDSLGKVAIDPEFGFYFGHGHAFIRTDELLHGPSEQLLGELKYQEKSIRWSRYADVLIPLAVKKWGPKNQEDRTRVHGGLFMLQCYPYFYDIPSSRTFDLSKAIHAVDKNKYFDNGKIRYWTYDAVWMNRNVLMFLYNRNKTDKTWLVWVDVNADKVLRRIPITTDNIIKSTLRLLDDGRVIGISKTYDAIIIKG